jgi:hypothetical protein
MVSGTRASRYAARVVVVVDVLRVLTPADRAHATLLPDELVELVGTDAVATLQVVVTAPPWSR